MPAVVSKLPPSHCAQSDTQADEEEHQVSPQEVQQLHEEKTGHGKR